MRRDSPGDARSGGPNDRRHTAGHLSPRGVLRCRAHREGLDL